MAKQAFNVTKNRLVVETVQVADNVFSRFLGLMGKPGIPRNEGLWIVPCSDIHSCFMRFEFDALFINKEGKVLHTVERMKAWRLSKFVRGGWGVLELDGGVIADSGTEIGDVVEFREAL